MLTWSSTNATACTASGGWSGSLATSGSESTGPLSQPTAYTLTCTGAGGSATTTTTVTQVNPIASTPGPPTLVQHVSGSSTRTWQIQGPSYCYKLPLPAPAIGGNAIVVGVTFGSNVKPTVTDDQNDTYAIAANYYDSSDQQSAAIAAAFNVASGAREIKVCFSGNPGNNVQPMATELTNVVGVDGSGSGNTGSGTSVTSGSLTPSASGDLAYQIAFSTSVHQSSFTAGSGQALLSADVMDGWAGQYGVLSSTSSITPTMGLGNSDNWVTAAVLFKTGTTGGVPAGLRVVHLMHENIGYHTSAGGSGAAFPSPLTVQFPCSGNLVVAMAGGGNAPQLITGITDSKANSWSNAAQTTTGGNTAMAYYAPQANCSTDLAVTTTWNGGSGDYTIFFYDVANAAPAPLDTSFTSNDSDSNGSNFNTPGNYTVPKSLTPSTSNEIVFTEMMEDFNTSVNIAPGLFDCAYFDGETLDGPEPVDENNAWGHYITTSTSPVSFTWIVLNQSEAIGGYTALAVAFKGQ
jgi:hypothetical protein